ncbi:hypothetical protein AB5J49_38685 [Streptomyces sp. R28]|uniref:Integral membrane protein n=1 Tax=Streptomyces sp. R28 TaxID=3238628 RepID=A0AB39Q929_9ACTN
MPTTAMPPAPTRPSSPPWTPSWACTTTVALASLAFLLALDLVYQLSAKTYASAPLPYVFLCVLDGFIALTIAAIVQLQSADPLDEGYAWKVVLAAMAARTITVAVLDSVADRQGPGGSWTLADLIVVAMSFSAPLIPLCAVQLYVLATEHAATMARRRGTDSSQERTRGGDA